MSKQMVNKFKIVAVLFVIAFSFMFVGIVNFAKADAFDLYSTEIIIADAEVRVEGDDGVNGLFFKAQMDADQYDALKSRVGEGKDFVSMETGLIIAPVTYDNHYELCEDTLFGEDAVYDWAEWDDEKDAYVYNGSNSFDTKIRVININANNWVSKGDYYEYEGGIVDVLPQNTVVLFEAIAYVSLVDAGGVAWRVFSEPTAESVIYSMQKQYDSFTDDQKAWVDENWAPNGLTLDESTWEMFFQAAFSTDQFTFQTFDHTTGEVSALSAIGDTIIVADGMGNTAMYFTTTEGTFVSVNNGEPQPTDKTMEEITAPFMQDMMAIASVYEMRDKVVLKGAIIDSLSVVLFSLVEDGKEVGLIEVNIDNGYLAGLCISRIIGNKEFVYVPTISTNPGGGNGGEIPEPSYIVTKEVWEEAFNNLKSKPIYTYSFFDTSTNSVKNISVTEQGISYNERLPDGEEDTAWYDFESKSIYANNEFGEFELVGEFTSKEEVIDLLIPFDLFLAPSDKFDDAYPVSTGEIDGVPYEAWNITLIIDEAKWHYSISFGNDGIINVSATLRTEIGEANYILTFPTDGEIGGGDVENPDNPNVQPDDYIPKVTNDIIVAELNALARKRNLVYTRQVVNNGGLTAVEVSDNAIWYHEQDASGNNTIKYYDCETRKIYLMTDIDMIEEGSFTSVQSVIESLIPFNTFTQVKDYIDQVTFNGVYEYDGGVAESFMLMTEIDGITWIFNMTFIDGSLAEFTINMMGNEYNSVSYWLTIN